MTEDYDALGRLTSYSDSTGVATTTTYDRYGNPETVTQVMNGKTVETDYGYADARGYLTSITEKINGNVYAAIGATWGPDGQLTQETFPGGVTLTIAYDAARVPVGRTYTDSTGAVIFSDSVVENHQGQWIQHLSTTATMAYSYDALGRLTQVQDGAGNACTTRSYGYDTRSNRTSIGAVNGTAGGGCPATAAATGSYTYDSADRMMSSPQGGTGTWLYDPFGRTTTMPTAAGTLKNSYYVNDLIAAQTITGQARYSWTLDPLQRRTANTQQTWSGTAWTTSSVKTSHYSSGLGRAELDLRRQWCRVHDVLGRCRG